MLLMSELVRAGVEMWSLALFLPALIAAPRGDGHPVLVIPGFATSDASTLPLRAYRGWASWPLQLGKHSVTG